MSRYTSPVNPAVFPHLTVVLLAIGMFFTAWFFVYPFRSAAGGPELVTWETEAEATLGARALPVFPGVGRGG